MCWPWNHDWTKWEVIGSGRLASTRDAIGLPIHPPEKIIIIGTYEEQRRVCNKCGKSQLRETRT